MTIEQKLMTNIEQELEKKEVEKPKMTKIQLQDQLLDKDLEIEKLKKQLKEKEHQIIKNKRVQKADDITVKYWQEKCDNIKDEEFIKLLINHHISWEDADITLSDHHKKLSMERIFAKLRQDRGRREQIKSERRR